MTHDNDLASGGRLNPSIAGIPLRFSSSGAPPDQKRIAAAAAALGRPVKFVDDAGYEREIIAASPPKADGSLACVHSLAKDLGTHIDVNFHFVVRSALGTESSSEIQSYNPYFGCDVEFLEWQGDVAVLIYREKHNTYVAVGESTGSHRYVAIGDEWIAEGDQIGHWKYKDTQVQRLQVPQLVELAALSEVEAIKLGLCPPKSW